MSGGDVTVIAPKVAGFISQARSDATISSVYAGDLLVKLDDRDYRAALAKATAAVAIQQATLDEPGSDTSCRIVDRPGAGGNCRRRRGSGAHAR